MTDPDAVLAGYPAAAGRAVLKKIAKLDGHRRTFLAMCPFAGLAPGS